MGKKTVKVPEDTDLFENGGLNDEDADAARPAFKPFIQFQVAHKNRERVEHHERDPQRRNNVCVLSPARSSHLTRSCSWRGSLTMTLMSRYK
jgi:hypothetical protein